MCILDTHKVPESSFIYIYIYICISTQRLYVPIDLNPFKACCHGTGILARAPIYLCSDQRLLLHRSTDKFCIA